MIIYIYLGARGHCLPISEIKKYLSNDTTAPSFEDYEQP